MQKGLLPFFWLVPQRISNYGIYLDVFSGRHQHPRLSSHLQVEELERRNPLKFFEALLQFAYWNSSISSRT